MEYFIVFVLAFGVAILGAVGKLAKTKQKQRLMSEELSSMPEFIADQRVMGVDGKSGLAFDESRKKICLIRYGESGVSQRVISYKDVLSIELFEDGDSISKTVRSSQIGSAIVGGLLLGGAGVLVGGLTGKTRTSSKIKRVDLRLIVNDTQAPLHDIAFMNSEDKKGGLLHSRAIQDARHWQGLVEVLIKRADADTTPLRTANISQHSPAPASIADELKKLAELMSAGVLTVAEFQRQKARLLGTDSLAESQNLNLPKPAETVAAEQAPSNRADQITDPSRLLAQAIAYRDKADKRTEAARLFEVVIARFPGSDSAELARAHLYNLNNPG